MSLGHNNPPSDEQALREYLEERNYDLSNQITEALEKLMSMRDCQTEEQAQEITDQIKKTDALGKRAEAERVKEKEPYLKLGRAVDAYFKVFESRIDEQKRKTKPILTAYLNAKAEEERKRRAEEAEQARRAAQLKLEQAAEAQGREQAQLFDKAAKVESFAEAAQARADASISELSRTRGYGGATASLRVRWVGEITDIYKIDLNALRPFLKPEEIQRAVNAFVASGGRSMEGVAIYEKTEAAIR